MPRLRLQELLPERSVAAEEQPVLRQHQAGGSALGAQLQAALQEHGGQIILCGGVTLFAEGPQPFALLAAGEVVGTLVITQWYRPTSNSAARAIPCAATARSVCSSFARSCSSVAVNSTRTDSKPLWKRLAFSVLGSMSEPSSGAVRTDRRARPGCCGVARRAASRRH